MEEKPDVRVGRIDTTMLARYDSAGGVLT